MRTESRLLLWSLLFSRLASRTRPQARQQQDVLVNLRNQLQRLINTRRTVPTPRYTWSYSTATELGEELRRCIVKTERRLRDVQVKRCSVFDFGADEHFDVSARMIVGDDEVSAHFHAVIEGMGMVRVQAA